MIKHTFLFTITLYLFSGTASAELTFLGDGSKDMNLNKKYCSQIIDITQSSADDLARSWKIPSASITLRNTQLFSGVMCCLTLDTPKGPFVNMSYLYYSNGTDIIAGMNNRGYFEGEQNKGCYNR